MKLTWFATFQDHGGPERCLLETDKERVIDIVARTPGLTKALIYTPWPLDGLPFEDGPAPQLQLQLYFDYIGALETAVGKGGHLQALADPATLPNLAGTAVTEQAMLVRHFPVAQTPAVGAPFCTFLVHYPGPAHDLNHWLRRYIDGHTPLMQQFPGIRGVEVCSRIDWCSDLPWTRINHMQRNKVVFDDATALKAALASPILDDMRADSAKSPPYSGGNAHFPMRTIQIDGR